MTADAPLRIELVTLFPEVAATLAIGLLGKAQNRGLLEVHAVSPREHGVGKHRSVDDAPYGGGAGMVLMPGPIAETLDGLDAARRGPSRRVLLSPQGRPFGQRDAERLARESALTFVCGRYEGFDDRIRALVHEEISLGDFVLLGGETAALAVIEAVARLRPGVLGNAESAESESHGSSGLLEHPHYTRPAVFRGEPVPDVLLSGNHAAIALWRRRESIRRTAQRRPELLQAHPLDDPEEQAFLRSLEPDPGEPA
ncbi:MAG: tRNA (guanosine(37)-N1)-methyltransferase TrmD [Myxococcota bacterium]